VTTDLDTLVIAFYVKIDEDLAGLARLHPRNAILWALAQIWWVVRPGESDTGITVRLLTSGRVLDAGGHRRRLGCSSCWMLGWQARAQAGKELLPQSPGRVFALHQATDLKDRHDVVDELGETGW